MLNHTELINYIIERKGFNRYLEIGTQSGRNFDAIKCQFKTGIDPDPDAKASHHLDSDTFFQSTGQVYDLIFLDGLHTAEQVRKDFINAMACISDKGVIVIHDTNPDVELWTRVPRESKQWTGSVYKFICNLNADFVTLPFDYGITVVKKSDYLLHDVPVDYELFDAGRDAFLNIISTENFKAWL